MSDKKQENNDVPTYDPEAVGEQEKDTPLMNLLSPMENDLARIGCTRFYYAETVFFKTQQRMLNYLPDEPTRECADGVCSNPYGPAHWLSVFQLACQIAQPNNGDFVLCGMFAAMHEIGRDWKNGTNPHAYGWMRDAWDRIPEFINGWKDLTGLLERHVPGAYLEQFGYMLPKVVYWSTMRWYESEVTLDEILSNSIESVNGVQFHPALTAAANACLDADYIWMCLWGDAEPNPKLAYTVEGRLMLHKMIDERE